MKISNLLAPLPPKFRNWKTCLGLLTGAITGFLAYELAGKYSGFPSNLVTSGRVILPQSESFSPIPSNFFKNNTNLTFPPPFSSDWIDSSFSKKIHLEEFICLLDQNKNGLLSNASSAAPKKKIKKPFFLQKEKLSQKRNQSFAASSNTSSPLSSWNLLFCDSNDSFIQNENISSFTVPPLVIKKEPKEIAKSELVPVQLHSFKREEISLISAWFFSQLDNVKRLFGELAYGNSAPPSDRRRPPRNEEELTNEILFSIPRAFKELRPPGVVPTGMGAGSSVSVEPFVATRSIMPYFSETTSSPLSASGAVSATAAQDVSNEPFFVSNEPFFIVYVNEAMFSFVINLLSNRTPLPSALTEAPLFRQVLQALDSGQRVIVRAETEGTETRRELLIGLPSSSSVALGVNRGSQLRQIYFPSILARSQASFGRTPFPSSATNLQRPLYLPGSSRLSKKSDDDLLQQMEIFPPDEIKLARTEVPANPEFEAKASEIARGKEVLRALSEKTPGTVLKPPLDHNSHENHPETQDDLSSLFWALVEAGNIYFEHGTIVVRGDQEKIKRIWEHINKVTYPRRSSHLKGVEQLGIRGFDFSRSLLPASHRHLLFILFKGRDEAFQIMMKAEEFGTDTWADWVRHGGHFVFNWGKRRATQRAQNLGDQKERISPNLISDFEELAQRVSSLQRGEGGDITPIPSHSALTTWGIQEIYAYFKQMEPLFDKWKKNPKSKEIVEGCERFVEKIKLYPKPESRFAAEIIIDLEEILSDKFQSPPS